MKKQIALIVSVLFFVSSVYAGGIESLFEKAIKSGRNNNGRGAYTLQVPASKNILVDDALQYMQRKGYILTKDYGVKQMIRFGYYARAIKSVEFIPEAELESYIANMPLADQCGKAVIFPNAKKEIVNVYWSGNVNNGYITGNGVGYTKLNNSMYVIKGKFDNGIPNGSCEVVTYTPVFGKYPKFLQHTDQRTVNFTVGNASNGYMPLLMNGKYGFINDKGDIVVSCKYDKVVEGYNTSGFAIVTDPSDGGQEIKINTSGTKLGYSDNQLRINEEKRLAKIAEEKRLAEEKKKKEEEQRLAEEERRKEEERIQREREKALAEARAEEERQERLNAKKGNKSGTPIRGKVSSFVDLGLPSGTLWAQWNVGASRPEECGDCFAWGETKKTKGKKSTEYTRDGQTLEDIDDAATANWGKNWRTPTLSEWQELYNYCRKDFTTWNGVNCCRFIGPNGNSIILPDNGDGLYMSATLDSFCRLFYGHKRFLIDRSEYSRDVGSRNMVRPVLRYTKDEYMMMSIEKQLGN